MPEIAEVELVRREVENLLNGKRIVSVETDESLRYKEAANSVGSRVMEVKRRGKYLIVILDDGNDMIIHLGMTGALRDESLPKYRARWHLNGGGTLTLTDPRGFGQVRVVKHQDYSGLSGLSSLGPEPLENFPIEPFVKEFTREGQAVKSRILQQKVMAGPGNYVADEALWEAKVHPESRKLTKKSAENLAYALIKVIEEALEHGGVSMRDYQHVDGSSGDMLKQLKCYSRDGLPCLRCGTILVKKKVNGRGSTYCPKCQKLKK